MEDIVVQRVKDFFRYKSLKNRNVAQSLNVSETTLNNKLNGTRGLDLATLQNIIIHYEELSAEWLLRGKGEMLLSECSTNDVAEHISPINIEASTPEASALYQIHNDMIKLTRELVEENTKLKSQVSELSQSENEIANILKDFRDSNKELSEKNRELNIELMIKDAQIREKEKSNSDYKEILKEAI